MPEFNQEYNCNSLYICIFLVICIYNTWYSNYNLIRLFTLYLNYSTIIIIINIIGLYFILKNLTFEINIKWTIKYGKRNYVNEEGRM